MNSEFVKCTEDIVFSKFSVFLNLVDTGRNCTIIAPKDYITQRT